MCRLGPFCLRGPALAFVGLIGWFGPLWALVGFCGPFAACVGLRLPSLAAVGFRGPALAAVGFRGPVLAFGGRRWLLWAFVVNKMEGKNRTKNTPRAQTTPDASFGPFFD